MPGEGVGPETMLLLLVAGVLLSLFWNQGLHEKRTKLRQRTALTMYDSNSWYPCF